MHFSFSIFFHRPPSLVPSVVLYARATVCEWVNECVVQWEFRITGAHAIAIRRRALGILWIILTQQSCAFRHWKVILIDLMALFSGSIVGVGLNAFREFSKWIRFEKWIELKNTFNMRLSSTFLPLGPDKKLLWASHYSSTQSGSKCSKCRYNDDSH